MSLTGFNHGFIATPELGIFLVQAFNKLCSVTSFFICWPVFRLNFIKKRHMWQLLEFLKIVKSLGVDPGDHLFKSLNVNRVVVYPRLELTVEHSYEGILHIISPPFELLEIAVVLWHLITCLEAWTLKRHVLLDSYRLIPTTDVLSKISNELHIIDFIPLGNKVGIDVNNLWRLKSFTIIFKWKSTRQTVFINFHTAAVSGLHDLFNSSLGHYSLRSLVDDFINHRVVTDATHHNINRFNNEIVGFLIIQMLPKTYPEADQLFEVQPALVKA